MSLSYPAKLVIEQLAMGHTLWVFRKEGRGVTKDKAEKCKFAVSIITCDELIGSDSLVFLETRTTDDGGEAHVYGPKEMR